MERRLKGMFGLKNRIITTFGCVLFVAGGYMTFNYVRRTLESKDIENNVQKIIQETTDKKKDQPPPTQTTQNTVEAAEPVHEITREGYNRLKAEYPLVCGYMAYDDGFIAEPIAQAGDNSYFLRKNLTGQYSETGTVFMDADCDQNSQNITLYGHNVYYDATSKFSPLGSLVNQWEYDRHNTFRIWYDDKVVTYGISYVVYLDRNKQSFSYARSEYTEDEYEERIAWLDANQKIRARNEYRLESSEDRTVTLQTCVKWSKNLIELVIAKEIAVKAY